MITVVVWLHRSQFYVDTLAHSMWQEGSPDCADIEWWERVTLAEHDLKTYLDARTALHDATLWRDVLDPAQIEEQNAVIFQLENRLKQLRVGN